MRTHGWGGDTPDDDDEAVRRILAATRRCLDRMGSGTGISDVARELNVTRQTVYRYFASTEDLLSATAVAASAPFLDELRTHLEPLAGDPAALAVEAVAFTLERVPGEPYLGLLLQVDEVRTFGSRITSESSLLLARSVLDHFPVDWDSLAVEGGDLDELAEFLLRLIQSLVIDPGTPPRRGAELRAFLGRWISPAVNELCHTEMRVHR
jgi:AcrR family transcriptional regulator